MRVLLVTHAFLWFVWNDPRLSEPARKLIEDPANDVLMSAASAWEIGIKISTGKLSVGQELAAFLSSQLAMNRMSLLPIELRHCSAVSTLPFHHKDPFDRLLIAQSLTEDMAVISMDSVFDSYGVERRW